MKQRGERAPELELLLELELELEPGQDMPAGSPVTSDAGCDTQHSRARILKALDTVGLGPRYLAGEFATR